MTSKPCAAIDIGTNSVRLLTCQRVGDRLIDKVKTIQMTRIGKGVDATGLIEPARLDATVNALKQYAKIINQMGIEECPVFATSALRDAKNGHLLLTTAARQTPFKIEILSGDEEALYGYLGVVRGSAIDSPEIVVVDVGGGSTEIIIGDSGGKISYRRSFDIGAVRLTDRFQLGHAMSTEQFIPLRTLIIDMLASDRIIEKIGKGARCIGIGGTATTLAAIDLKQSSYDGAAIQRHHLAAGRVTVLTNRLIAASRQQKLALSGLQEGRVDIIAAGAYIIDTIMQYFERDKLYFSDSDNLEGAIYHRL